MPRGEPPNGGFPRAYLAEDEEAWRDWLENYIATFLERDLPSFGVRIPATTIRRFWSMLSHMHANILNYSELGRSMQTSDKTVRLYVDLLEHTFMVRVLRPWFSNTSKRLVKNPKVYIRDSGLFHQLQGISSLGHLQSHPKLGASWEGYALEECIKSIGLRSEQFYFWATHSGAEVDLYWTTQGKNWAVEFKFEDAPRMTRSMHSALGDLELEHLWVVYPGKERYLLHEKVSTLPLAQIGLLGFTMSMFSKILQPKQDRLTVESYLLIGIALAIYTIVYYVAYQHIQSQAALSSYVILSLITWLYGVKRSLFILAYAILLSSIILEEPHISQIFIGVSSFFGDVFAIGVIRSLYLKLKTTEQKLRQEYEKSELILGNIFPKKIVERLKHGEVLIADKYLETTILFSDLVGFTQLTRTMQPHDLVMLLDRLITGFDHISEKFGVEKIKTIGDAYLVVSGLPEVNTNHARSIVNVAREMILYVNEFNYKENTSLQIRIGIHSGSVIGGVIGPKKFTFDLWGDTVNLASRLESTGVPGKIQVSQTTYELVKDDYKFTSREVFDIKGYGFTQAYFLED